MPPRAPFEPATAPRVGRRERNKADKRARILDVAGRLFADSGYEAVTTQQIAEQADVGTGTLFRYFPTKAELLVEVMNDTLRSGRERALRSARQGSSAVESLLALVTPLLAASAAHPENTAIYQRELLFGDADRSTTRAVDASIQVVDQVIELEAAVIKILQLTTGLSNETELRRAAHAIYATAYVDVIRATAAHLSRRRLTAELRSNLDFLIARLAPGHPPKTPS